MSDSRIALSRSRLIARDRLSGLRNARGSLRLTIWRNFQVLSRLSGLRPVGWHHQCSHAEPRSRATLHPVRPRGDHHMVPEPCCSARILIVDDESAMVQLLEQLLSHAGYTNLLGITDSRTVVERCDDFLPDLVMLDLRMPRLDGVEVLKRLKQRRAELYLPVLVLTADVSRESKRAALEAGASDFVTKPFEQTELLLRVRNLIEMRFLHRDLRRQNQSLEGQIQERHAIQDTPLARRLSLITRSEAASRLVRIEVADSGPGIPPENLGRIFEPFFTTKPEGEGTGLGLALVRGIVEGHGGTITVESRPGEGTRFVIELPLGTPPDSSDELDAVDATLPVPGKTILVVDDEPAVAMLLAEALSRDGYKIDMAANGAVALRMLAARSYDLIISDSGMPGLGGCELYREIERREPHLTRRFVFVTGDILNSRTRAFLARTGAPQLEKPFTVESVKRVVRRALLAQ